MTMQYIAVSIAIDFCQLCGISAAVVQNICCQLCCILPMTMQYIAVSITIDFCHLCGISAAGRAGYLLLAVRILPMTMQYIAADYAMPRSASVRTSLRRLTLPLDCRDTVAAGH